MDLLRTMLTQLFPEREISVEMRNGRFSTETTVTYPSYNPLQFWEVVATDGQLHREPPFCGPDPGEYLPAKLEVENATFFVLWSPHSTGVKAVISFEANLEAVRGEIRRANGARKVSPPLEGLDAQTAGLEAQELDIRIAEIKGKLATQ